LESSGLTGFTFLSVEKKLIVELHWEAWNMSAEEPPEYPASGEPEGYILEKPHSTTAATALGELWEVVVPLTVEILRPTPIVSSYKDLQINLSTWDGSDLIRGRAMAQHSFPNVHRIGLLSDGQNMCSLIPFLPLSVLSNRTNIVGAVHMAD
jgi:hypothetical protein